MYCKVSGCRYSSSHTTRNHTCGKCKSYGHGQIECGNLSKISYLSQFNEDKLPSNKYCVILNCDSKEYHSSNAHHCKYCTKLHPESSCAIQPYEKYKSQFNLSQSGIEETLTKFGNGTYIEWYMGMGCTLYIKNILGNYMALFMHSDDWGQYGQQTNLTPLYESFIDGYTKINENDYVKDIIQDSKTIYTFICPLCRTSGNQNNVVDIKGSCDECKVCLSNNVELFFSSCSHACCCKSCFEQLKE